MNRQTIFKIVLLSLIALALPGMSAYPLAGDAPEPDTPPHSAPAGATGTNFWTWQGPQYDSVVNEAPMTIQIVMDPSNPNIVYAGTNQGVYRSTDGGENWEPRNGGLGGYGDLVVTGIAIDPTNSQTLVIGTWGYGLLRSTDSGANWSRLADPLSATALGARALDERAPHPIVAGGPSYTYQGEQSRFEPQAQPVTWQRTALRRVTINPANSNEIFACVDDGHGLYRSTNGGSSWEKLAEPPGVGSARSYTFAPSNNQVRYASFGSWGSGGGFYRTENGGASWDDVGGSTITHTVTSVAIHPTNPDVVLAATSNGGLIYRSENGGDSWSAVGASLPDFVIFSVAFAPSAPDNTAYAGGYYGIYYSNDGGKTSWVDADGSYPTDYVEGLAIHPTQPETVLVGSNRYPWGGVYKRTSVGSAFALKATGMQDTFVLNIAQDPSYPDILYAATWGAGVFRSVDSGNTWNPQYSGFPSNNRPPYVYAIEAVQGPGDSTVLYAGTFYGDYGVFKSYNRGDTWFEVSRTYPSYISFDIESIYGDPDHLVAATYDGIQYSTNGGVTWNDPSGLNAGIVLRLCEFPGTGRLVAATYGGGLYFSDGGIVWLQADTDMNPYTYDVACSPDTAGLAYTAGLGVYRTTSYGLHWQLVNGGLANDYFRAVDVAPTTGDVFAGSHQNGVYMAPNGSPVWTEINTGLVEWRTRSIKIVSSSPARAFVGTNGRGAWDYTMTARPTRSSVSLPLALQNFAPMPPQGIHGQVTYQGLPIAGIHLLLRFYDGSSWSTAATTVTQDDGTYRFSFVPSLAPGQQYYVRYNNGSDGNANNSDYLWNWSSFNLTSYTAGEVVSGGDFDIANVWQASPAPGATVALPHTFQWMRRTATPLDSYEFNLFDPADSNPWWWTSLGYVNNYTLVGLPTGFTTGTPYGWSMWVYGPDGGAGTAYYYRSVTFSSGVSLQGKVAPERPPDRPLPERHIPEPAPARDR